MNTTGLFAKIAAFTEGLSKILSDIEKGFHIDVPPSLTTDLKSLHNSLAEPPAAPVAPVQVEEPKAPTA